jgi:hypothetical protein
LSAKRPQILPRRQFKKDAADEARKRADDAAAAKKIEEDAQAQANRELQIQQAKIARDIFGAMLPGIAADVNLSVENGLFAWKANKAAPCRATDKRKTTWPGINKPGFEFSRVSSA